MMLETPLEMAPNKFRPEENINKLREAEVHLSPGNNVPEVACKIGITSQPFHRWHIVQYEQTIQCLGLQAHGSLV